nr:hypothetical protein [Bacteroidota bacterium]
MKRLIIYTLLLCGIVNLKAQTNADCINAIPLCTTPNFTFFSTSGNGSVNDIPTGSNISNPSTNPNPPNSGCLLSGENVPQWLLVTIGNSGNLEFVFGAGNSANPQVGYYDWAMWPYNANTCSGIMNNTLPPVRCNWNATSSGGTGIASAGNIPPGGNAGNYQPPLAVSACQQYIICISNFSGVNTLVSFQSLGTASLSCNPNCNPNYVVCAGSSATIVPVNFNGLNNATYSLQPSGASNTTGSFVVTPSSTTTYTTYITGTNSSNAIQTTTALSTVTVNPKPVLSPTYTQATCASPNNAVNLGLSFNPPGATQYTVNWSPMPASVTSNTQTVATNLNAGTTNVTVTAAGGCSSVLSFTMSTAVAPTITLTNLSGSFSITCKTPSIDLVASSNYTNGSLNYLWSSISFTANTPSVSVVQTGSYNVCVTDPSTSCSACTTFTINQNTTTPTSTVNPSTQIITCNSGAATFTSTSLSPTVNVSQFWYSPLNPYPAGPPTFTSAGAVSIYGVTSPGTYTIIDLDNVNGCITTKTINVTSVSGFPGFNTSSTSNYSLGCTPLNQSTLCAINATS